jgi:hypothetical protein
MEEYEFEIEDVLENKQPRKKKKIHQSHISDTANFDPFNRVKKQPRNRAEESVKKGDSVLIDDQQVYLIYFNSIGF